MKKKALDELKTKDLKELGKRVADLEKEKINVLLELKMGKSTNVHSVLNIKKDIAKIKTIIKMKQIIDTAPREKPEKEKNAPKPGVKNNVTS